MANIYVKKQPKTPRPSVKSVGVKLYNHSGNIITGDLCKECKQNKTCKDKGCPVYKWRK